MKRQYFEGCYAEDDIKRRWRDLCKQHHPDLGGDLRTMQAVNADETSLRDSYRHTMTDEAAEDRIATDRETAAPAVARLHYFGGSADAWIVELDCGAADDTPADYQRQAWGKVDLGWGAELGYVSIPELLSAGLELDLHWQPRPVSECGKE